MDNNEIRKLTDVVVAVRREADEKARGNKTNAEMRTPARYSYLRRTDVFDQKKKVRTNGSASEIRPAD